MAETLKDLMIERIVADGPLPVSEFMALALGHPEHGYYMTRDPFGVAGDFTTAPEISQVFGELIGACLADLWLRAGQPSPVILVEAGPGRGTLMADLLRTVKNVPGFIDAMQLHLVETSAALRVKQAEKLTGYTPEWHDSIDTLPNGFTLLVANELLDALPVEQYEKTGQGWARRGVTATDGELSFTCMDGDVPDGLPEGAEIGAICEASPAIANFVGAVSARLAQQGGAALLIDYGYEGPAVGDTLQALAQHKPVSPLDAPGEADVTAHVDFTAVKKAATGVEVHGPVTQGAFLQHLGIELRAEHLCRNVDAKKAQEILSACHRLTSTAEMGTLFKVVALTGRDTPKPEGF